MGVVSNPQMDEFGPGAHSSIYGPMTGALSARIFVRLRPEAKPDASALYALAGSVESRLRLDGLATVEDAWRAVHRSQKMFGWIFALVAGVTLILSIAGIHAIMSFTVTQRTREIAIRTAVGASPTRVIVAVFTRAFGHSCSASQWGA